MANNSPHIHREPSQAKMNNIPKNQIFKSWCILVQKGKWQWKRQPERCVLIVSKRKSSVELAAEQLFKYCELYKASAIPNVLSPVFSFWLTDFTVSLCHCHLDSVRVFSLVSVGEQQRLESSLLEAMPRNKILRIVSWWGDSAHLPLP